MRILVLHREGEARAGAVSALRAAGFEAAAVGDRAAAEQALAGAAYDGLVADDVALVSALRQGGETIPALVLSAEGDGAALVQYGADDYLVWPVDPAEIVERVRSMCRAPVAAPVPGARRFAVDGAEYAVLELLLRTPGAVVTRARLERECGAGVDEVVERLRARVGDALRIEAVRGIGFRVHETEAGRR
ncbi:response regulator transcription factor [Kribbella sp. NPDC059898]|uniref:response regulator transcription factor n=1 Tax=Kribbella sp. NPDC059898 TaxID=3346995 RepID=UPI0036595F23